MISKETDTKELTVFNNRILLFAPYFGQLPDHFPLWLKSCQYNPTIDWVLFVDKPPAVALPDNVRIIETRLEDFRDIISKKLDMSVAIRDAYKLCDFKPTYGFVFEDLLKGYSYWGHCDIDLIFGDIRKFITDEILHTHDKILFCGHLTIYRNTPSVNKLFMYQNGHVNYKEVFADPECRFFDEHGGMDVIAHLAQIKQYSNIIFADISHKYNKLTLTELHNHKHQVFYWENGEVFREYLDDRYESLRHDSFAYIHFQKRKMKLHSNALDAASFFITPNGFEVKKTAVMTKEDFSKYNNKRLMLFDLYYYNLNRAKSKIKRMLTQSAYRRVGKNE
ncbi:hypothetical protein C2I18_02515 [Paenibacillus sp. PK3_47]|uniref:DUF6625 family protein n=1 Tax=Paenibacillus sp. PK3_47 TaxID=2072642 RepID=UPI00201E1E89|nr:DUF6625 family protein [Paenibacillus sp. PK3_47]UQZ32526.1 hypothetical protein C2I18_02515 [Paenibacillus sp. PK3_47]